MTTPAAPTLAATLAPLARLISPHRTVRSTDGAVRCDMLWAEGSARLSADAVVAAMVLAPLEWVVAIAPVARWLDAVQG